MALKLMVFLRVPDDLDVAMAMSFSARGPMALGPMARGPLEVELLELEVALARGRLPVEGLFCASCSSPPLGSRPPVEGP